MLVIRLSRRGKKGQPSFRLVVAEKRSKLAGEAMEDLGSYSTFTKKATFNKERIKYWMSQGAKLTPTVQNLLVNEKVLEAKKVAIHMKKKAVEAATAAPAA